MLNQTFLNFKNLHPQKFKFIHNTTQHIRLYQLKSLTKHRKTNSKKQIKAKKKQKEKLEREKLNRMP